MGDDRKIEKKGQSKAANHPGVSVPAEGGVPQEPNWFRGGVNKELLKEFVRLEKEGKLAT